jgi:hypothetical protein
MAISEKQAVDDLAVEFLATVEMAKRYLELRRAGLPQSAQITARWPLEAEPLAQAVPLDLDPRIAHT